MNLPISDPSSQIAEVKERISNISGLALEEHCDEYEQIHSQLKIALSEIDGI
ncbi:MAG: hypothetical protein WCH42_02015 [Actinomycetes bacterium]